MAGNAATYSLLTSVRFVEMRTGCRQHVNQAKSHCAGTDMVPDPGCRAPAMRRMGRSVEPRTFRNISGTRDGVVINQSVNMENGRHDQKHTLGTIIAIVRASRSKRSGNGHDHRSRGARGRSSFTRDGASFETRTP